MQDLLAADGGGPVARAHGFLLALFLRETEIKQLQGWKGTVENLIDKFQEALAVVLAGPSTNGDAAAASDEATPPDDASNGGAAAAATPAAEGGESAEEGASASASPAKDAAEAVNWEDAAEAEWGHLSAHQHMQLAKLRVHFHKDVRKQLYGDTEDKQFFDWLKQVGVAKGRGGHAVRLLRGASVCGGGF